MPRPVNAMSVDVEDYFQVLAFSQQVDRDDWDAFPCRVERNIDGILGLFDRHGTKATFFTLGWVAERYPRVIRRIVDGGHELASHGFAHVGVHEQTLEQFRADVRRTRSLLEDVGGTAVKGYRAASFSISAKTPWAFDVLGEEGYVYSSSVYPVRHDIYGMPDAPRFAFRPVDDGALLEIPITTCQLLGRNLPCGGGGYFRLAPYAWSRWAMRRVNHRDRQPCMFYFHPWEIDPDQPRIARASLKSRFRHYVNLGKMRSRLERLLVDFEWNRIDRVFLP
jgi:polysaccharide deacetylase family protein (PEP-CTERM system associated)